MCARAGPLPVIRDITVAYVLSTMASALLLVTSVAGLLFGQRGLYRPDPQTLPTFLGQDGITLVAGLPLLVGSMWLARRGSLRALLLWPGGLFYFAYSYAYYLLSPEFNVLYLAYIAIASMSGYALLYLLLSIDAEAVRARFSERAPVRLAGGFLAAMALLIAGRWVAMIVSDLASGTAPSRVDLGVWPMDLAVAFPAMFWGGVWLWRKEPLGYLAGGLLLVKAASVGLTLVVNTWLVTRWGQPADPMLPAYAAVALGGIVLTVAYVRGITPADPRAPGETVPRPPSANG
jgi:hypothetical protein